MLKLPRHTGAIGGATLGTGGDDVHHFIC